jgi:hypothetical protein
MLADHLVHSIQVDTIMESVQRNTLLTGGQEAPEVPGWAVPVALARRTMLLMPIVA